MFIKKTNKNYKMCKDCFNKKVMCSVCNQMINKTYLKKHIEKYKIKFGSGMQKKIKKIQTLNLAILLKIILKIKIKKVQTLSIAKI